MPLATLGKVKPDEGVAAQNAQELKRTRDRHRPSPWQFQERVVALAVSYAFKPSDAVSKSLEGKHEISSQARHRLTECSELPRSRGLVIACSPEIRLRYCSDTDSVWLILMNATPSRLKRGEIKPYLLRAPQCICCLGPAASSSMHSMRHLWGMAYICFETGILASCILREPFSNVRLFRMSQESSRIDRIREWAI